MIFVYMSDVSDPCISLFISKNLVSTELLSKKKVRSTVKTVSREAQRMELAMFQRDS